MMPSVDMSIPQIPNMPTNSIGDMPGYEPTANFHEHDSAQVQSSNPLAYNTHTHGEQLFTPDVATPVKEKVNSHGIDLLMTDNNVDFDHYVDPEIAAAAYDKDHSIIQHNDQVFLAPIDQINPDAVELSCDMMMNAGSDSQDMHDMMHDMHHDMMHGMHGDMHDMHGDMHDMHHGMHDMMHDMDCALIMDDGNSANDLLF